MNQDSVINPYRSKKSSAEDDDPEIYVDGVKQYSLSRSLLTVQDVWNEWAVGIAGTPPIRDLESEYGTT